MKQIINRMELRFPSGSVNESFARGASPRSSCALTLSSQT